MSTPAKKLRITEDTVIVALNAPRDYRTLLRGLPPSVVIKDAITGKHAFIHLFVKNKAELERELVRTARALEPDGLLWISYPKGRSGMQTDLTRDRGWDALQKVKMQWLSLISFSDDWSAFLLKNSPPKEQSKASRDYRKNSSAWVDPKKKIVRVPADVAAVLAKNKKARERFDALSFTNRKEYVLWVVGAKREETREDRVKKTIAKLVAGKKNPAEK
jgi:hypothetical protein